ncbi:sensory histidine kinase UhpB [Urinicoccus massiliensis]|uniref:Sensory histidine kinase UhpB n=1 Tax=Urinicoccus massiliensis TaxID=1723382 RepID=A0A8H2QY86_9FIRM|nr:ATP-binding protein [Urinicoccus massiliensis]VFB16544.1 sensory histidine kinase UhpB [Urinicoccus massiliensis]
MTLINLNIYQLALLFIFNTIILVASVKIVVDTANSKVHAKYFIHSLFIFSLSFFSIQILAEIGTGKLYFAKPMVDLPLYLFIIFDLFLCALEILFAIRFIKTEKSIIGKNSIKESMDNLPDGICFAKLDGRPLLVNRVMQDISYAVFGNMLVNDVVCAENVRNNKIKKDARILQRDPLIVEALGDIWYIKILIHDNLRETLAYKITLEWGLYQEIEEKNRQIEKINKSLKEYQKNVAEYTRQKEILQAKIKIHDKIGQSLIYFKRYLDMDKKTKEDRDKLINLWMESLVMLNEKDDFLSEKEDSSKNEANFEKLISTAKDIGVAVHLEGETPKDEGDLTLLVDIVHEALNNAIRHGQAKNLWIKLDEGDLNIYCKIRNDGIPSKEPIKEKGGLKNIHQRIKSFGGKMNIELNPQFTLDLSWPKGGNYDL